MVGLANIALAVVVIVVSRRTAVGAGEEKLAQEIRDMAYAELSTDVDTAKAELERITDEIAHIRMGIFCVEGWSVDRILVDVGSGHQGPETPRQKVAMLR